MREITDVKTFIEDLYVRTGLIAGSMAFKRDTVEEIINTLNARVKEEDPGEDSKLKKYQYLYKELRVRAQWGMDFFGGPFTYSAQWAGIQRELGEAYEKIGYDRNDLPEWTIQPIKTVITFKQDSPDICSECLKLQQSFEPESFMGDYEYEHMRYYDILNHFINDTYQFVAGGHVYEELLDTIIETEGETSSSIIIKIMFKNGFDFFSTAKNCYSESAVNQFQKAGLDSNTKFSDIGIDRHFMQFFMNADPIQFKSLDGYIINRNKLCTTCQDNVSPLHLDILDSL